MPILGIIAASIQKAYALFSDNFNRTTSGSLGTSSSGGLWETVRGTWFANSISAESDDLASTYPISTITMSSADSSASISVGSSPILISSSGTVGSVKTGGTASGTYTYGVSGFFEATITGMSSTTGIVVGDWISATAGTGAIYGGTPDYVEVTQIVSSTSIKYRTKGGTAPVAGNISNISTRSPDGGSGVAVWVTDSGNWWGVLYGRSMEDECNCSTCNSGTCVAYSQSSYCNSYSRYNAGDTCFAFITQAAQYSKTNYQTTSGTWANTYGKYVGNYCSSWRSNVYSTCSSASYSNSCSSTTYAYSSCECQTCYPPYISIIQSTSNAVTEAARWSISSMASKIKVIADSVAKTITVRPYKDSAMTTQIGSDLTKSVPSAIPTNNFGIVLGPSDNIQGNTLDDFSANNN